MTRRLARALLVAALSSAFFLRVFHFADGTWQTSSLGGWIDPYFINFILEHWRVSLLHLSNPASPLMYFPAGHTLGYSCGLILYVPWYVLLRVWYHPFAAYTLTVFMVMQVGTWSLYAFLRRGLGLGFVAALVLTFSVATSLNVVHPETGAWTQRASVFLIPQILWLAAVAVTSASQRVRIAAGLCAGLMSGLMFVQYFPSAAFTLLSAVLVIASVGGAWRIAASVTASLLTPRAGRASSVVAAGLTVWAVLSRFGAFRRLTVGGVRVATDESAIVFALALLIAGFPALRRTGFAHRLSTRLVSLSMRPAITWWTHQMAARSMAVGVVVGVLVFLWIYLPAYLEHPAFPRDQLLASLKTVTPSAWQTPVDAFRALMPYPSARPFQLIALVALLSWSPGLKVSRPVRLAALWLTLASVLVLLLPVRFPAFSLWLTVVAPVPGMSAVRDPVRLIPFYELGLTLAIGAALSRATAHVWFRRLVVAGSAVVMALTWNPTRFDYERPRVDYARWVEPPIRVDPACRSFFLQRGPAAYEARSTHIWSLYALDAAFVSLAYGMPTLNGYSAWAPDGWDLADPRSPEYEDKVRAWIAAQGLSGTCALDLATRMMRPWQ